MSFAGASAEDEDASPTEERIAAGERRALEMAEEGAPLRQPLEELVRAVEAVSSTELLGSILLLDEMGTRLLHAAAPTHEPTVGPMAIPSMASQ